MRRLVIAVVAFLGLHTLLLAQASRPASIEGSIVRAGTGEPLAGAVVTLTRNSAASSTPSAANSVLTSLGSSPSGALVVAPSSPTPAASPIAPVTTDWDGKFVFSNLEPGVYRLQVSRNGYARLSYGQRTLNGPSTALDLVAGQSLKNVVMALIPAGNVTGVIRDPRGQAQTGVPVQLLRATFNSAGDRTFQVAGTARTDDRGQYRLYWITPGRYYLSAGTASGPNRTMDASGNVASPNEIPNQSFTLTYYPGVVDPRGAGVLDIQPSAELSGIDLIVPSQQLYRVRGHIVDAVSGRPPDAASVSLAYRNLSGNSGSFSAGQKYDPVTGEFELRNVPPGSYVVQAIAVEPPRASQVETVLTVASVSSRPNARLPIEVAAADVEGVTLSLSSGVAIPGRLSVDGQPLSSIAVDRIRVQLKPTVNSAFGPNLQPAAPTPQAPNPDGTFLITGVSTGEFVVGPVTGLPAGVYVKEARFLLTDVLSQPLQVSGATSGTLEIVLSSKSSQFDGVVVDTQGRAIPGAQVVLVPDRQRNRRDLYKTTLADSTGRFVFRSVPPGDYRVFAWEALESYGYFDQDLLRAYEPKSVPALVTESAGSSVTVQLITAN